MPISQTLVQLCRYLTRSPVWDLSLEARVVWMALIDNADQAGNLKLTTAAISRLTGISEKPSSDAVKTLIKTGNIIVQPDGTWHLKDYDGYLRVSKEGARRDYFREYKRRQRATAKATASKNGA